jgi:hypothetical protein
MYHRYRCSSLSWNNTGWRSRLSRAINLCVPTQVQCNGTYRSSGLKIAICTCQRVIVCGSLTFPEFGKRIPKAQATKIAWDRKQFTPASKDMGFTANYAKVSGNQTLTLRYLELCEYLLSYLQFVQARMDR